MESVNMWNLYESPHYQEHSLQKFCNFAISNGSKSIRMLYDTNNNAITLFLSGPNGGSVWCNLVLAELTEDDKDKLIDMLNRTTSLKSKKYRTKAINIMSMLIDADVLAEETERTAHGFY